MGGGRWLFCAFALELVELKALGVYS
jgi:hypothetical protein